MKNDHQENGLLRGPLILIVPASNLVAVMSLDWLDSSSQKLRVNVVSPGWVKETLVQMGMESAGGTAASDVARAYVTAVEGTMQGQTIAPKAL